MYARAKELLTPEERLQYLQIPPNLSEWELSVYFTLTQHDIDIIQRRRRDYNRLGFAVQICVLRYLGRTIFDVKEVPAQALSYIAKQVDVDVNVFASYGERDATKYEHLDEIRKEYGYKTFTFSEYRSLYKHLFSSAMVNGASQHLIEIAIEFLRGNKTILPSMATIERTVWEARKRAEEKIFNQLCSTLTEMQKAKLDVVLTPMPDSSKTYLAWLKDVPGANSPDSFLKIIEKIEYIRGLNLQTDTQGIHPNRLRQLSKLGSRYEPRSFRRFNKPKSYAVLVAFLLDLVQDLTDMAFEIHDKQITLLLSKGKKAQDELQKQNGKSINEKVVLLAELGTALINARNEGADPFVALDAVVPWERLVTSVEEAKRLARPIDYNYLDLLKTKFYVLRKYTPALLKSFEFRSTKSAEPLLAAVEIIRDMNETGKRKVPKGAPDGFIPKRWIKHIYDRSGAIDRHYYEMAVLTELRDRVRAGDVAIVGSRRYKDFEEYLIPKSDWGNVVATGTKLAVSLSVKEYLEERTETLLQTLKWVSNHIDELVGVSLENGKLHIERLEKDTPDESRDFNLSLYGMLPRIKLTDLLMEVANWTDYYEQFTHASSNREPDEEETTILIAALMAMGTNIGLQKMAEKHEHPGRNICHRRASPS